MICLLVLCAVLLVIVAARLGVLIGKVNNMNEAFQRLLAAVAAIETKADSLIELSNQLAQLIRDNANNPAALLELAARLEAQTAEVQAAIDANTPPTP